MSDANGSQPAIVADSVWVRFWMRRQRSEQTVREAFVRVFEFARRRRDRDAERASKEFWALRGIDVRIHRGETIGLIGHNGAGKTTFLKTLAGICPPDRGSVTVQGRVSCLLSFGVGFNPRLSGRENVYLNGSILGLSRREIDTRMDEIIEFSELGDFIDSPTRTYSAGMRGRLGFSIAIHVNPDILLLDEVLSVGDAAFRKKAGTILERFHNADKTVVLATHSLKMVRESCDRAMWLDHGTIRAIGPAQEIADEYEEVTSGQPADSPEAAETAKKPVESSAYDDA
ncbi:MAG: ABC transporter ATP-binding protein [Phycisphaerae bacterium]